VLHLCGFTQVIEGGNYDVDVTISSKHDTLYKEQKKQYDQHTWTAQEDMEYRFCFSNEFSTVTHKIVYFDFQAGDDDPLQQPSKDPATAMTQVHIQQFMAVIDFMQYLMLRAEIEAEQQLFMALSPGQSV